MRKSASRTCTVLLAALLGPLVATSAADAAGHTGRVTFRGQGVPGATVTAIQGSSTFVTTSDRQGVYTLADLPDGTWTVRVDVNGFASMTEEVVLPAAATGRTWELKMLTVEELASDSPPAAAVAAPVLPAGAGSAVEDTFDPGPTPTSFPSEVGGEVGAEGLLIAGTIRNAAASPFAQAAAFGNFRPERGSSQPYFSTITIGGNSSAWNATPYSRTLDRSKPDYGSYSLSASVSGPMQIPWLLPNGPRFQFSYQHSAYENAVGMLGRVPTALERQGVLGADRLIRDPVTGLPFPDNTIPVARISPQAAALLGFYPLPNVEGDPRTNFQATRVNTSRNDSASVSSGTTLRSDQLSWSASYLRGQNATTSLLGFDTIGRFSSLALSATWRHQFRPGYTLGVTQSVDRQATDTTPHFANRANVSGEAGIHGNNQEPRNWGLPTLAFSGGIAGMADASFSSSRNHVYRTEVQGNWTRRNHDIMFGGHARVALQNEITERNARGSFLFTGFMTGSPLSDFLLGLPQSSSLAFGSPNHLFRANSFAAFFQDDMRLGPSLSLNLGVRWEHSSPVTESLDRLVNLDVADGFLAVRPVLASDPIGGLSGRRYGRSLVSADWKGFQPRLSVAWRPNRTSSLVVRSGYDWTFATDAYLTLARLMAGQPPLATTGNAISSLAMPLTLADGFASDPDITQNTFAVDPQFKPAYAQNWNVGVQRDMPASLALRITYNGTRGRRLVQQFLPNTVPEGAANSCASCPQGFRFVTSGGRSQRDGLTVELRRRSSGGLTAAVAYTLAKATDDSASFGDVGAGSTAQNWLDLAAESGPSAFDQRHRVTAQVTWSTGVGVRGGAYLQGWAGRLLRGWTMAAQLNTGSGFPVTPLFVPATPLSPPVRASLSGAPLNAVPDGFYLNPAAYAAPGAGAWGDTGRNSARGPRTFALDGSLSRSMQIGRLGMDARVDATNLLNRVVYTGVDTLINSPQFGQPTGVASMRRLNARLSLRF